MTVSIEYEAEKKLDLPYEKIIKEIVEASLDFEKCPYEAEVNVILTDNDAIQAINKEYRQIDAPTDVLSFPMVDYEKPSDFDHVEDAVEDYFNPETGELMLGDIVISVDKVEEQRFIPPPRVAIQRIESPSIASEYMTLLLMLLLL